MYYYQYSPKCLSSYCTIFREKFCHIRKIKLQYLINNEIL